MRLIAVAMSLIALTAAAQDSSVPLTPPSVAAVPGNSRLLALETNGIETLALTTRAREGDVVLDVSRMSDTGESLAPLITLGRDYAAARDSGFRRSVAPITGGFVVVRECGSQSAPSICADTVKGTSVVTKTIVEKGFNPKIAFNGTGFVVTYTIFQWGGSDTMYLLRLDVQLGVVGTTITLAESVSRSDIIRQGSDIYLGYIGKPETYAPLGVYGQVIHADGRLEPAVRLAPPPGANLFLAVSGETIAFLWERSSAGVNELQARFITQGALSSLRTLHTSQQYIAHAAISPAPSGFVVIYTEPQDARRLPTRIQAIKTTSSGDVETRFVVESGTTDRWSSLAVRSGSGFLFAWSSAEPFSLTPATPDVSIHSRLVTASGIPFTPPRTTSLSIAHQGASAVVFTGDGYLVAAEEFVGDRQRSQVLLTFVPRTASLPAAPKEMGASQFAQISPRIVPGASGQYLVLWAERDRVVTVRNGDPEAVPARLMGALVDASGRVSVAPFEIAAAADDAADATWNGIEWAVVWSTKDARGYPRNGRLQLSRVRPNGVVMPQTIAISFASESIGDSSPSIAWSGERYLVAWNADYSPGCRTVCVAYYPELRARRLARDFQILDASPLVLSRHTVGGSPFAVWNGESFVVASTKRDAKVEPTIQLVPSEGAAATPRLIADGGFARGFVWDGTRYGLLLERSSVDVEIALLNAKLEEFPDRVRIASSEERETGGSIAAGPGGEFLAIYGLRSTGNVQRLRSKPVDALIPSALAPPRDLVALSDERRIFLEWVDQSTQEEEFEIEFRSERGEYKRLGTVPTNTTSVLVQAFPVAGTYFFRVRARTLRHSSRYSNEATARIETADVAPADLAVASVTRDSVTLSWSDRSASETGFVIEVLDTVSQELGYLFAAPDTVSFTVTDLHGARSYAFRVRASLGSVETDFSNVVIGETLGRSRGVRPALAGGGE